MKVILFVLLISSYCLSQGLYQDTETNLPLSEQHEPENSYVDATYNFLKSFFVEPNTWDRSRILYKQWDQRWGSQPIKYKTICNYGCLMTSVAMALNARGKTVDGSTVDPGSLNSWLKRNGGYVDDNFQWDAVRRLGLSYVQHSNNHNEIQRFACDTNFEVVLNVQGGSHYVLVTGLGNGGYIVNDPGYMKTFYANSEVRNAIIYRV